MHQILRSQYKCLAWLILDIPTLPTDIKKVCMGLQVGDPCDHKWCAVEIWNSDDEDLPAGSFSAACEGCLASCGFSENYTPEPDSIQIFAAARILGGMNEVMKHIVEIPGSCVDDPFNERSNRYISFLKEHIAGSEEFIKSA